jgi:ATP-dependent DNA helicase DinG
MASERDDEDGGAAAMDAEAICAEMREGGAIARRLPFHETREAQLDLMRLIVEAFNEKRLAAAEAGTGVGKSFAYLLPALIFAEKTGRRVVISTATITLQQQLFEKDIPLVSSALNTSCKAALIKGRGHFLCRRRLAFEIGELAGKLDLSENETLRKIDAWAKESETGSRTELPFFPPESLWASVASEADTCLGMRCPDRERCFVMMLRKKAAEARILVVNHHLLFADLAARSENAGYEGTVVLPPYKSVVLDEAHAIEGAATGFFSEELSRPGLNRSLLRLFRARGTVKSGLLFRLLAYGGGAERESVWSDAVDAVRAAAAGLESAALELCGGESVFRLIPARGSLIDTRLTPPFRGLAAALSRLIDEIVSLCAEVEQKNGGRTEETDEAGERAPLEVEIILKESGAIKNRLIDAAKLCTAFTRYQEYENDVFWIERRGAAWQGSGAKDWAVFTRTPIDVSGKLRTALFEKHESVVCLSATLTVGGSFEYWTRRAGIQGARDEEGGVRPVLSGTFPSPFPYARSVLTAAALDVPLPGEAAYQDFLGAALSRLIGASGGSALILFTSFESLRAAYAYAAPRLSERGIRVLRQGDDDRGRLLRTFLDDTESVLFATDSFWEGVDAPGDTLRLVAICRLPFRTPNDPVFEARCEAAERRGGNPFMELSLPEAVIKFRQGFGRLIRRSSDRGVVAVLDARVIKKRYGELFLRSIPPTKTSFTDFQSMLGAVERFLS